VKGEYSIDFNQTSATLVMTDKTVIQATTQGILNQVWLNIVSPPQLAGKTLKAMYSPAPNGPEVRWLELAFGDMGADAPSSIVDAMSNAKDLVLWLSQCLSPACEFHLSNVNLFGDSKMSGPTQDYCNAFGQNCSYCISHHLCGWCSQAVTYQDGSLGNQCAGFNPDSPKQPFTCSGSYSTEMCLAGYVCNTSTSDYQCTPAPAGDGVPLAQCQASCKAPIQNYRCDNATKQCVEDKNGSAQSLCEAYCSVQPHGNTPTNLEGMWRGLEIRNGYTVGEFDFVFNNTSLTLIANGAVIYTANVQQQGPLLALTIESGPAAGKTVLVMYQFVGDALLNMATFAFGQPAGLIPASFDESMSTAGETEYVMAKCLNDSACHFST
jgi:hypothetical protein